MNKVIFIGRLCRNPELRYTSGSESTAVCRYTLAVDRSYKRKGEPDADFFNIVAFNARGEFASKYFKKGMMVAVVGELRNNNYTDKDGIKHYNVNIIASEQYFAESKKKETRSLSPDDFVPTQEDPPLDFQKVDESIESEQEGLPF